MLSENEIIAVAVVLCMLLLRKSKVRQHDSALTGKLYCEELLNTSSEARFRHAARMDKPTFGKLLSYICREGGLTNSRYLMSGEMLLIFLHILAGNSIRASCERWQHSPSTISKVFHQVRHCFKSLKKKLFLRPDVNRVHDRVNGNPKFSPFFDDCIGALDGTHIPAVVSPSLHGVFRNRKGFISQNVLAVVNLDGTFSFALAGWEGCAHDGKVLQDAKGKELLLPDGKYYLADAGYALARSTLTPYRGVRYHLKEWERGNVRPANKEELFNLRHASLRNIVERVFGVLKKRFSVLVQMPSFQFAHQVDIVMSCFMLHNFIRMNQGFEDEFDAWTDAEQAPDQEQEGDNDNGGEEAADAAGLKAWRDLIAQNMWTSYQVELERRGIV